MARPGAMAVALGLALAAAPVALGQEGGTVPEPVTAPAPPVARVQSGTVRLRHGALVRDLRVTLGPGVNGIATVRWVAYGGSRAASRLARLGHGSAPVQVRDGELRFTRRVHVGGGYDRSGGFCEQIDLTSLGYVMPKADDCPDTDTTTRDRLPEHVPEFSMYADSVGAGLLYGTAATTRAAGEMSAVFDLKVCRRLTYLPCPPNPPSALSSIRSQSGSVGDIAVVDVGYNDWGAVYGIDSVVSALRARGVKRIVWVTLRERQSSYAGINGMIRQTAKRHSFIQVADWNARSSGLGGFAADGVHLSGNSTINALADFIRDEVAEAAAVLEKS